MGLQTPSAPSVLPLIPPLNSQCQTSQETAISGMHFLHQQ
uniref:Uncharacterized protein n=1 Tax=Trichinella nativa TaxID=6335 RepID=A0A0V1KGX4_9BILA